MKKIALTLAIAAAALSAQAEQTSFIGPYGQIGLGYQSVSPSISSSSASANVSAFGVPTTITAPVNVSASRSNSLTGTVTIGYMAEIRKDFLLGIGAEYSPIAGTKTSYSGSVGPVSAVGMSTQKLNAQYNSTSSYNLFVSPATPIGANGLLYAKLGYTGATLNNNFASSSNSIDYTGYSLGMGYKQIIQGGLYGFAEANYFSYGKQSKSATANIVAGGQTALAQSTLTSSANAYNLLLGVGYKF